MTYYRPRWARVFPENPWLSIVLIAFFSALLGPAMVFAEEKWFADYGLVLFVAVPVVMGFLAPLAHGMGAPRKFGRLMAASFVCQVSLFSGLLFFGIEGLGCLLMAAPLWGTCAVVGTLFAYPLHRALWRNRVIERGFPVMGLLIVGLLPMSMGLEHSAQWQSPSFVVQSEIDIDAPPEVVWNRVVRFPDMPPPRQWMFKLGVARPIRAELDGTGASATRYCVFSTGRAVEPVRIWDEPKLLEVEVTHTPSSMEELSPYPGIHPPHLEGYFESEQARFELIALPSGGTKLIGTSWYRNRMFPAFYWRWWSDAAVKDVQVSVLDHIKALSEQDIPRVKLPVAGPGPWLKP